MGSEAPATVLPAPAPASPRASLPVDGSVVKMKVCGDNEPGSDGGGRLNVPVPSAPPPFAPFSQGLPFKANVDDVIKFYQGFSIVSNAVYLKRHADGRLNGEVCVRCSLGGPEPVSPSRKPGRSPYRRVWPTSTLHDVFVLRGTRSRGGWGGFGGSPFFGWLRSSFGQTGAQGRSCAGCIIRLRRGSPFAAGRLPGARAGGTVSPRRGP
jgi:hypothetical protein